MKIKYLTIGAKASFAYFLANMVNKGIAYLCTPIYTNMLSSEEYGQVSVFLIWQSIIGIVAMFSFQAGVFNNGMIEFKEERNQFTLSLLVLSNIISLVVGLFLLGIWFLSYTLPIETPLLLLMLLVFIFQPAYNFWITRQRFEYKYKMSSLVMVTMNLFSPIVAIVCIYFAKDGYKVYARLFGAELAMIAFYLFFYIQTFAKSNFKISRKYWKFAFIFNLPLIPHYLSQYILNGSDKIMISGMLGDKYTAYYSVAYSVAAVVSIIWISINSSLVPYTYEKCEKKEYKQIGDVVSPLWIVFATFCLLLMFFSPEILALMAPSEYSVAKYVIPPVIGGVFFQSLYYSFANINYYFRQTKFVMYASLSAAAINIMLNYWLLPVFGFMVAGYTTLLSYVIQAIIDYYAMRLVLKERVYNEKMIVILSVIVIVTSCLFPLMYDHNQIRFILFAFLFTILFIRRNACFAYIQSSVGKLKIKKDENRTSN